MEVENKLGMSLDDLIKQQRVQSKPKTPKPKSKVRFVVGGRRRRRSRVGATPGSGFECGDGGGEGDGTRT